MNIFICISYTTHTRKKNEEKDSIKGVFRGFKTSWKRDWIGRKNEGHGGGSFNTSGETKAETEQEGQN